MPGVLHPVAASLITSSRSIEDRALRDHLASEKARRQGRLRRHGRHDVLRRDDDWPANRHRRWALFSLTIGKALANGHLRQDRHRHRRCFRYRPRRCDRACGGWCERPRSNRERRRAAVCGVVATFVAT
jgi:hypothetical protein